MFLIVRKNKTNYYLFSDGNWVEVLASKNGKSVKVRGRTKREAISKATQKLK